MKKWAMAAGLLLASLMVVQAQPPVPDSLHRVSGQFSIATQDLHGTVMWGEGEYRLTRQLEDIPPVPHPPGYDSMTREERQKWFSRWRPSEEGKAFAARQAARYTNRWFTTFSVRNDGSFVIPDLPAGMYHLTAEVKRRANHHNGDLKASLRDIRVQANRELGFIRLASDRHLQVGQMAPLFTVPTLEGGALSLADYRGRYVLLDFCALWCPPCRYETRFLKEIQEKHGDNPAFAMIALNLDKRPGRIVNYARKHQLTWEIGFLGNYNSSAVAKDSYCIHAIPAIFLVGPDGRILEKNLRGTNMVATVDRYLDPE